MWDRKPSALFARRTRRMIQAWWGTAAAGIALLLLFPTVPASAELRMRFLDVRQGDSTLKRVARIARGRAPEVDPAGHHAAVLEDRDGR
jgi:hypothetical protein